MFLAIANKNDGLVATARATGSCSRGRCTPTTTTGTTGSRTRATAASSRSATAASARTDVGEIESWS
jgi:hypothetical protein